MKRQILPSNLKLNRPTKFTLNSIQEYSDPQDHEVYEQKRDPFVTLSKIEKQIQQIEAKVYTDRDDKQLVKGRPLITLERQFSAQEAFKQEREMTRQIAENNIRSRMIDFKELLRTRNHQHRPYDLIKHRRNRSNCVIKQDQHLDLEPEVLFELAQITTDSKQEILQKKERDSFLKLDIARKLTQEEFNRRFIVVKKGIDYKGVTGQAISGQSFSTDYVNGGKSYIDYKTNDSAKRKIDLSSIKSVSIILPKIAPVVVKLFSQNKFSKTESSQSQISDSMVNTVTR